MDIFGDHHETELFWGGGGGHLYTFQAFYRSMYRIGFFSLFFFFFWAGGGGGGLLNLKYFLGRLIFLTF